jgi:UPF0271 protein
MEAVDLNADLAEGDVLSSRDLEVLDTVTSASLACGFHAGNRAVMHPTAVACITRGVVIGAHVSFRNRDEFGRRAVAVPPARLVEDIIEQCAILVEEVARAGGTVEFVKPHGALYNLMSTDTAIAASVVDALSEQCPRVLVAQAGTAVVEPAERAGLRVVAEGFPDRGYLADGRLVPRGDDGATVDDPAVAAERAVSLAVRGGVTAVDGTWTPVVTQTLCIHGDAPGAAISARMVRAALEVEGVTVRPFVPDTPGETTDRPPS